MPERRANFFLDKLKRLTSMGPREIVHRVREKGYSHLERLGLALSNPHAPEGRKFKEYLAGEPARRFYCGPREDLQFIRVRFPEWIDRAVKDADRLLRHQVQLLQFDPVQLGADIDWHRDPITGRTWERQFWTAYNPEKDAGQRDSKNVHELNRHQHLPRLAKAYHLTGDERYAAEAIAQIESWIAQNPPGVGINWQSSLEIGIRTTSWLWTLFFILPSRAFTDDAAQRIGDSLFAQLEHVHRYTSLFSSPNTHLIGEAAALFIAGMVFQDQARPAVWMKEGAELLIKAADQQVLDDGAHGELSAYYHCYALDFYQQAMALARQNDYTFPARVHAKVKGMLNFVMQLRSPGGAIPLLGDDDGGRALALEQKNYRFFNDALCQGAVIYNRGDLKYLSGGFYEETFWLLGEKAWETFEMLESREPEDLHAVFPVAGYAVQRSGWGPLDSRLVFDTGGLGMLTGGHSHADALSIVLASQGRELLIDPGTSVYNCAAEWRSYFRGTRAHNTVAIDGRDQAETGGTFRWETRISARAPREPSFPPEYIEAEHEGYLRLAQGVTHRRRLLNITGEYWILVDEFPGYGQHSFEFDYHFGADVDPVLTQPAVRDVEIRAEEAGLFLGIYASHPMKAKVVSGQTEPLAGWASRGYGHRQPTKSLSATMNSCAGCAGPDSTSLAALTLLVPDAGDVQVERLNVESGSAVAVAYRHGRFKDIAVFCNGTAQVQVAGFRMKGEFFWLRMEGNTIRRSLAIRGRIHRVRTFLEEAVCAPFAAS